MKTKIHILALIAVAIFATSCSKGDESFEPFTPASQSSTYITYSNNVSHADEGVTYTIQYLSNKGIQTINDITGNFTKRVPAMTYDSAGSTYVRTMLSIKTVNSDVPTAPTINSTIKIVTDNGFVIAQTSQSDGGCGYSQRTVTETTPLSWFSVK
jgi:hypothetical protein